MSKEIRRIPIGPRSRDPAKYRGKMRGAGGLMGSSTATPVAPKEDADTLRSTQYAQCLDMISEGPIGGLVNRDFSFYTGGQNPAAGIYFNDTPLATDPNAAYMNYNGVQIAQTTGEMIQAGNWMLGGAEDTVNAGIQLMHGVIFTFAIDDPDTTRVVIAIRVPELLQEDDKGNILTYWCGFSISVQLNLSGWINYGNHYIDGKCTSDYVREYVVILPKSATPWDDFWQIQLMRITEDDPDSKHDSVTIFDYYTTIVDYYFMYPYSALVWTQIDASQLSDIPIRGYTVKGRFVWIPSNYFADSRSYSRNPSNGADAGVYIPWDGNFYQDVSNNPAWCFYEMATNTRYGAGEFLGYNIDKWSLYQIAQYCDQLVPDGYGSWEPRFTCNTYIQTTEQAWKVLSDLASVFRGALYWGQGQVVPVADMPKPIMHSFTNANVVNALFTYSDNELKNRFSDATVTWNDPNDFFNQKVQAAFDIDQRITYGFRETKFTSYGCTSRGQARRHGMYTIETNRYEVETVLFQTGFEAMYLRPGDIIGIVDNDRIGLRQGGRLKSFSGNYLTLDAPLAAFPDAQEIAIYNAQTVDVIGDYYPDSDAAANQRPPMMWNGYIYGMNGQAQQTIYVQDGNGNPPPTGGDSGIQVGSIYVIGANLNNPLDVPQKPFRIVSIVERDRNLFEITAVAYEEGKYDLIDFGIQFQVPLYTRIPAITFVLPPNNLTAQLTAVIDPNANTVSLTVVLNWEQPPETNILGYVVKAQPPNMGWDELGETTSTTYNYPVNLGGLYNFQVCTMNHADICSQPASVSITVPDPALIQPHRISGLELQDQGNGTVYYNSMPVFSWRLNSPTASYEFNSEAPYGADAGNYDPFFTNFEITVIDAQTDVVGWVDHTTDLQYAVVYQKNQAAWGDGQARHNIKVSVQSLNSLGINWPPSEITVDNPAPESPTNLTAVVGGGASPQRVTLSWVNPSGQVLDFEETYIFQNTTNDFPSATQVDSVAANGNTWHSAPLATGTYYFFITAVDAFFSQSQPVSVSIAAP